MKNLLIIGFSAFVAYGAEQAYPNASESTYYNTVAEKMNSVMQNIQSYGTYDANIQMSTGSPMPSLTYQKPIYIAAQPTIYTKPVEKIYAKPVQPVYVKPVESVETKPVEPVYAKPVEPVETKPAQPVYVKPAEPVETKPVEPVEPVYTQPVEPVYVKPVKPVETKPVQPDYVKPVEPIYTKPVEPVDTKPVQPIYTKPVDQVYTKPVEPVYTQTKCPEFSSYEAWQDKCVCWNHYKQVDGYCVLECKQGEVKSAKTDKCIPVCSWNNFYNYEIEKCQACPNFSLYDINQQICKCLGGFDKIEGQCLLSCQPGQKREGKQCIKQVIQVPIIQEKPYVKPEEKPIEKPIQEKKCPAYSYYEAWRNKCICWYGFIEQNGYCVKQVKKVEVAKCPEFSSYEAWQDKCVCWNQYQMVSDKCLLVCSQGQIRNQKEQCVKAGMQY